MTRTRPCLLNLELAIVPSAQPRLLALFEMRGEDGNRM